MLAIKKHKTTLTLAAIFSSALLLIVAALYFEHVEGLLPCIQCVYQRLGVTLIQLSLLTLLTLLRMYLFTNPALFNIVQNAFDPPPFPFE